MHNIGQVSDTMDQVYLVAMQCGKDQDVLWTSYDRICTESNLPNGMDNLLSEIKLQTA